MARDANDTRLGKIPQDLAAKQMGNDFEVHMPLLFSARVPFPHRFLPNPAQSAHLYIDLQLLCHRRSCNSPVAVPPVQLDGLSSVACFTSVSPGAVVRASIAG